MKLTRRFIYSEYVKKNKTYRQIAKIAGVNYGTIRNRVVQFNIKRRPKGLLRRNDLTGKRFGRLTVIRLFGRTNNGRDSKLLWEAKCDCGNVRSFQGSNLSTGHSTSCGCVLRETGSDHFNWKGFGDIGEYKWKQMKSCAATAGKSFKITIRYAWGIFIKQNRKCALSGVPLHFARSVKDYNNGETTASLDRIDSSIGYVKGNVQWVHKSINKMKSDLSDRHFIEMCKAVARHNS